MPRHCSVYGCKSNYDNQDAVSTFSLPKSDELRAQWIRKIPTDLSKLKHPVICIKHFDESQIIRKDCLVYKGEYKEYPRKIPKLKDDAVPCIFPNVPSYLNVNKPKPKRIGDVEEENMLQAIQESLLEQKRHLEKNTFKSLQDVRDHVQQIISKSKEKMFCLEGDSNIRICFYEAPNVCPNILGCIVVKSDLSFEVYVCNQKLNCTTFSKFPLVNNVHVLEELIENVEKFVTSPSRSDILESVIYLLKSISNDSDNSDFCTFIIEQLTLSKMPKNNRRYSNHTLILAATLFVQSTSAYNALLKCDYLCLPSIRVLRSIMSNYSLSKLNLEGSIDYLNKKKPFLKEHELLVNIQLDEIYIQPMFNFKGGSFYGSSENNPSTAAKTAQVFMISSVVSSYKDVVSMVPINGLNSNDLYLMILQVLEAVEKIGFQVISLVSDNNNVNRSAFALMTPDKTLQPYITHPFDKNRLLFFVFDTVHILKSIRNNWLNKKLIAFPDFDDHTILKQAEYKNLELMYDTEKSSVIKYGHLLSKKALHPSSVQKQNVKLALSILNEKNIAALKSMSRNPDYAERFENADETCDFIQIFTNWWKVVNCKSIFESERFNDKYRAAITDENSEQIQYLKKFSLWLKNWRQFVPISESISFQTFQALITTTDAFIKMSSYLFSKYDFINYILLGKFQTDALESRFGMYRQMSGSNYYISYLQLLESEKKLRFKSNIIISSTNANVPLTSLLPDADKDSLLSVTNIDTYLDLLLDDFSFENISWDQLPILVYISGYAVMKELRRVKCNTCQNWLQTDNKVDVPEDLLTYIEELDRGKLTLPTEAPLLASSIVHFLFTQIVENFENDFLNSGKQLGTLYQLSCMQLNHIDIDMSNKCDCNLLFRTRLENICLITCKIMLNNFTKYKNDLIENTKRSNKKLKKFNN